MSISSPAFQPCQRQQSASAALQLHQQLFVSTLPTPPASITSISSLSFQLCPRRRPASWASAALLFNPAHASGQHHEHQQPCFSNLFNPGHTSGQHHEHQQLCGSSLAGFEVAAAQDGIFSCMRLGHEGRVSQSLMSLQSVASPPWKASLAADLKLGSLQVGWPQVVSVARSTFKTCNPEWSRQYFPTATSSCGSRRYAPQALQLFFQLGKILLALRSSKPQEGWSRRASSPRKVMRGIVIVLMSLIQ